jgi:hypothetical protein
VKVFVFAYDRFDSISTPLMLEHEGIDHIVLCHTEEQRDAFIAHGRVMPHRLVVTGNPRGLAYQRNAALDMMDRNEWAMFLVEDIKAVTEVGGYDTRRGTLGITMENQREFAPIMQTPITMERFVHHGVELAAACDLVDARLGGFACYANPVWRDAKWKFNVLADGRAWVVRKGALLFDENVHAIDDMSWCAQNIRHYGLVVVNQWVLPDCHRYTPGGYGSIEDRRDQKLAECAYLVRTHPSLVRYAKKAGHPEGTHVVLRRTLTNAHLRSLQAALAAA